MTFPRSYRHFFSPAPEIVQKLSIGNQRVEVGVDAAGDLSSGGRRSRAESPDFLAVEFSLLDRIDDRADFQTAAQLECDSGALRRRPTSADGA